MKRRRTGCLIAVVTTVAAVGGALFLVAYPWDRQELPAPLYLGASQLAGTWASPGNGSLVLRDDGTFTATELCGTGQVNGIGSVSGNWEPRPGRYAAIEPNLPTGGILLAGGNDEIEEGGSVPGRAVLWMFRGAPGDSGLCVLHKQ